MKSIFSKAVRNKLDFGFVFGGQRHAKSGKNCIKTHVFLEGRILSVFFQIFAILVGFWEAPGGPKNYKNRKKLDSGRIWNALRVFV